jgi:hypothetical protein
MLKLLSFEYPVAAEEIMSMVDAVVAICVLLYDWTRV